jgi:hypothetical protein
VRKQALRAAYALFSAFSSVLFWCVQLAGLLSQLKCLNVFAVLQLALTRTLASYFEHAAAPALFST